MLQKLIVTELVEVLSCLHFPIFVPRGSSSPEVNIYPFSPCFLLFLYCNFPCVTPWKFGVVLDTKRYLHTSYLMVSNVIPSSPAIKVLPECHSELTGMLWGILNFRKNIAVFKIFQTPDQLLAWGSFQFQHFNFSTFFLISVMSLRSWVW